MRVFALSMPAVAGLIGIAVFTAAAQAPERPERGPNPGGREGRFGGTPFVFPLMKAIDADGDGELSAKEMENASVALQALDKDKNGKLTADELRPEFGRSGGRGPGAGAGPGVGAGGENPEALITQLMTYDKNGDAKLSKDELPEGMKVLVDRVDRNKDGLLDRAELTEYAAQRSRRGPGSGGESFGGPGGRGDGGPSGPRGGGGGNRRDRRRPSDAA